MMAVKGPVKEGRNRQVVYGRLRHLKRAAKSFRGGDGVAWIRKHELGRGGFGFVSVAISRDPIICVEDDGPNPVLSTFAVKSAEVSTSASLRREVRILLDLKSSSHVVRCYGDETTHSGVDNKMYYNILLENCEGGNLAQWIKRWGSPGLSEDHVKSLTRDIVLGLVHVHGKGYVHCDMKPSNVLIACNGDRCTAKIADLGLAKRRASVSAHPKGDDDGDKLRNVRGTTRYLAPEAVNHGVQDSRGDIWGLGCIVLEMMTGEPMWGSLGLSRRRIEKGIAESPESPQCPSHISAEGKDFLERCLARSIGRRWSAAMLLDHPFLSMGIH